MPGLLKTTRPTSTLTSTATNTLASAPTGAPAATLASSPTGTPTGTPAAAGSSIVQAYQREVSPQELSRTQLDTMLRQDSPLMQLAQNQGAQYAASRGLLNSSIAGQAAQGAMIDRAQPFALQDASAYANVYDKNLAAQNQFGLQRNDQVWTSGESALDRSLLQSESALERANRMALQKDAQSWTSGENVLDRSLTQSESAAERASRLALQESDQSWRGGQNELDRSLTTSESALERANRLALQGDAQQWTSSENIRAREQESAVQKAAIEAEAALSAQKAAEEIARLGYSFNLDQKNVSKSFMATTAQNTLAAINGFLADPNMNPQAREGAIQNAIKMANEQLAYGSTLYSTPVPSLTAPGGTQTWIDPQPLGYNTRPRVEENIKAIYANDLGRNEVDAEGLQYWTDQAIQNSWTTAQLRDAINASAAIVRARGSA